jgi:hypothetical protein
LKSVRQCSIDVSTSQKVPGDLEADTIVTIDLTSSQQIRNPAMEVLSDIARDGIVRLRPNQFIPKFQLTTDLAQVPFVAKAR